MPSAAPTSQRAYYEVCAQAKTLGEPTGRKELTVDARRLASGLYFVRLHAEADVRTRRLSVMR